MRSSVGTAVLKGVAVIAALVGATLCWLYVDGAIVQRLGEPDQSMVFWALPILLMGLVALALAVVLWLVAKHRTRADQGEA